MSKDQWNERYDVEEYIYGVEPNEYLRSCLQGLKPGTILFPAEGEGRNAVYAAMKGWEVFAFDQSEVGRRKALQLAADNGVSIQYNLSGLDEWNPKEKSYDAIAFIFVHMPAMLRKQVHRKAVEALKPGGELILQAFTPKQLSRSSGGPKNIELLFEPDEVIMDFDGLTILDFRQTETDLLEGRFHQGKADVVQIRARK